MPKFIDALALASAFIAVAAPGAEMPRNFRSARMAGQGGAGLASVRGYEALLYNPANLADTSSGLQELVILGPQASFSQDMKDVLSNQDKLSELQDKPFDMINYLSGKDLYFAIQDFTGASFTKQAVGLVAETHADIAMGTNPVTFMPDASVNATTHIGLLYGYGQWIEVQGVKFAVGGTAKAMSKLQHTADLRGDEVFEKQSRDEKVELDSALVKRQGSGFGADLGLTWAEVVGPVQTRTSLQIENLGYMAYSGGDSRPSTDKQTFNFGAAVTYPYQIHSVSALFDWQDLLNAHQQNTYKRLHLGGAYNLAGVLGVNFGFNQGYPTYGFQLGYRFASFEYASYGEEKGDKPGQKPSQRSIFNLKLGWWL